jgi:hypothetical protein
MRTTYLLPLLFLAACGNAEPPRESAAEPPVVAPDSDPAPGCYLGHQSNTADSIQLRLEPATAGSIRGTLRISIAEKDSRNGEIYGTRDADGIFRTVFHFMQEGVTDSIQMQFRHLGDKAQPIEFRASAYDAQTGREYPDTSKDFSSGAIQLRPVACPGL